MKKILLVCIILGIALVVSNAHATDWSQYESGRDNIRLDGYQGQPGYIAFTDGNGVTRTLLYANAAGELVYIPLVTAGGPSSGAFDLKTQKLGTDAPLGWLLDRED